MIPEPFLRRADTLGEGMICLPGGTEIAWVDILGKRLMRADLDGGDLRETQMETEIGAVLPGRVGEIVLVLRRQVVAMDLETGARRPIWEAGEREAESNRFNDATVDPFGNLWITSMDFDAEAPTGNLWRLTPQGNASVMAGGFPCLNGPAFSPDGKHLYLGDTMNGKVLVYGHDPESGRLTEPRVFVDLRPFGGLSDGMTVDAGGNLWLCQATAGRVGRFAPDGTKIGTVALPVPIVTSCCFGGPDLSTLYITTARIILDECELEAYPDSGSLYRVETNATGLEPVRFEA